MRTIQNRPKKLSEMIGQKVVLDEFKNRSKDFNFENNMLFVGQSGSGKSTLALISAKLLNCKNPIWNEEEGYYEPCNECKACEDVNEQRYQRDIYYMDATYMGKEAVERLHEKTASKPMFDKNKVIIIDEAHLLNSKEARGGMLTLAEKKKDDVYFILCTTDSSKFDDAFHSRFIQYKFRQAKESDIGYYIIEQLKSEGYSEDFIEDKIIKGPLGVIIENSGGSIRQALQYIERVLEAELFTEEEVEEEFGFVSLQKTYLFIQMLLKGQVEEFWEALKDYEDWGYIFNYINRGAIGIMKYAQGYNHFKYDVQKETADLVLKNYWENFKRLYQSLYNIHNSNSIYFSKVTFEMEICNYFEIVRNKKPQEVKPQKEQRPPRRPVRK